MRISDWSSDLCSSDLLHGVSPTAPSTLRVYQFRHSRRCPLAWPPARSGSYSVPAQKGNGKFGREFAHEFMDQTARQGLANSDGPGGVRRRSEEHTSELQSLMRISYAVFCLKKNNK